MGKRGPQPLPTATKEARGTRRKSREKPGNEPKVDVKAPTVPAAVAANADARACWRKVVPQLIKMRVLGEPDAMALEGLCMAYARALAAEREVKRHGLLVKTAWDTLVQNPAVSIAKAAWIEVRNFSREFGLTPSSRTNARPIPESDLDRNKGQGEDTAEDFLFGNQGRVVGSIGR